MRDCSDQGAAQDADEGYRAFFAAHFVRLVTIASAVSGDPGDAEDIAQEAMGRAFRNWDTVRLYDEPSLWVRKVAVNLALNRRRSVGRRNGARQELQVLSASEHHDADPAVWLVLASLPGQQRAALVLRYYEGRPIAEIATILGVSTGTAKVHLHRGRAGLRRLLRTQEDD